MNFRQSNGIDNVFSGVLIAVVTILFVWGVIDTPVHPTARADAQMTTADAPRSAA